MNFKPEGIIPALVTPLNENGSIDEKGLILLLDFLEANGIRDVFIISSTGEAYGLDMEEKRKAIEMTVNHVKGRITVYAGTGCITTRDTIVMTQMAQECEVDAVSIVTPYFISPSQNELITHYQEIARNTDLPILLYNNVARTGVSISPETVQQLAKVKNIVGIKDSSGDMTLAGEYIRLTRELDFNVLIGRDTMILSGLCYGASGAIAACANIAPRQCIDIYEKFKKGDLRGALEAQFAIAPLRVAFSLGSFPVVIKEALEMIGINVGNCLSPISPLNENKKNILRAILKEMRLF